MVGPLVVTLQPLIRRSEERRVGKPAGSVSVTVTVPKDDPEPMLLTLTVYGSATSPCLKVPLWLRATVRSATWMIDVGSLALLLAVLTSPPPATLARLVSLDGAWGAMLTLSVSTG